MPTPPTSPACSVAGCAPMSASRFTVACCMRAVWQRVPPSRGWRRGPTTTGPCRRRRPARRCCAGTASACGSRCPVHRSTRGPAAPARWRPSSVDRRNSPGGREAVVGVDVPLVAERAGGQRRGLRRSPAWRRWCCARSASCRRPRVRVMRSRRAAQLTMNSVPVSAFSGRPPSAGGLKRGSRQVPVQTGDGIDLRVGVRLLVARRASGTALPMPSMLFSQRVFQNTSLPLKKARLTPASRAASTFARCAADQYSSWPTDRKTLWLRIRLPERSAVDAGGVADVVAVGLEPADHRVLGVEQPVLAVVDATRAERPVVADLVGAAGGRRPMYRLLPP